MKKSEKINDAIGNIDSKMIENAFARQAEKRSFANTFGKIASVAAVAALVAFAIILPRFAKKDNNIAASSDSETTAESTETTETTDNSEISEIMFMTPEELTNVTKIHVTSLPEGYDYSFAGEEVKPITDYLVSLHPVSIDDNDGYLDGMTWVIELTYADGTVSKLYHIANSYIRKESDGKKYYKLSYEEANEFYSVISGNKIETTGSDTIKIIPDNDGITEKFIEILKRDGWFDGEKYNVYHIENAKSVENVTPDNVKKRMNNVYLFETSDGDYFFMVNDIIYRPFTTFGGWILDLEPCDYNKDGITDLAAHHSFGSGIPYVGVSVFDLKTMKTTMIYSINALYEEKFTFSCDDKNIYINNKKMIITDNGAIPEDFSFSLVWNTFGISSYDSKTGTLIKTKDATDVSKYTANYKMTNGELAAVYKLLRILKNYPDIYDPYNDPNSDTKMTSEPNRTVIISFTAFGYEKTITCNNICFGTSGGYDDAAQLFLAIEKQLEEIITNSDVWQSFPDYEFLYD